MYNFTKNRGGFGLNFKRDADGQNCNFRLEISLMSRPDDDNCRLFPTDGDNDESRSTDNDESHGTVPVPATGNVTVSTRAHHYIITVVPVGALAPAAGMGAARRSNV